MQPVLVGIQNVNGNQVNTLEPRNCVDCIDGVGRLGFFHAFLFDKLEGSLLIPRLRGCRHVRSNAEKSS